MSGAFGSTFAKLDYVADDSVTIEDPYPFFDYLRGKGRVYIEPVHGIAMVTGYAEVLEAYHDHEVYSAANESSGPFYGLPLEPGADDITDVVDRYRETTNMRMMLFQDPPQHDRLRGLVRGLFTPRRLAEQEEFIRQLADEHLDELLPKGSCEFVAEYAAPFAVLVIADLLGLPADGRQRLVRIIDAAPSTGTVGDPRGVLAALHLPLELFVEYLEDRRRHPRGDVLSHLALARFPDGGVPSVEELAMQAALLFAAGSGTTIRTLGFLLKFLGENEDFQREVRSRPDLIPRFVEEMLRMEPAVKAHYRLVRKSTTLGGVALPAGTSVMLLIGATNRDPTQFDEPNEFRVDRANAREHVAFGRGAHSCLGQALARTELRLSLERILGRTNRIRISEDKHGPAGRRRYQYDPTYLMRGLRQLHLELD